MTKWVTPGGFAAWDDAKVVAVQTTLDFIKY